MRYQGKESDFQKTIARYLNLAGVLWAHCPNETKGTKAHYFKRAAEGVKSGVPDILIFEPRGGRAGLAVELKTKYNKPSVEQVQWLSELKRCGWEAFWSNDIDEVLQRIDNYLSESETKKPIT